jgi:hypothetical protein
MKGKKFAVIAEGRAVKVDLYQNVGLVEEVECKRHSEVQ